MAWQNQVVKWGAAGNKKSRAGRECGLPSLVFQTSHIGLNPAVHLTRRLGGQVGMESQLLMRCGW
ncbi:hypothetical protein [Eikenella longinqua]|uniref:hypothetical protein n=1 Tax=Eikenella longinqua TaxID=1795827 RepID=UPI0012E87058|nr:hypothetical protein [Eikenella longinqua]